MRKTQVAQRKRLVYPRRTKSTSTTCERPVVLGIKRSLESALATPPVEELSGSPRKNGWIKSLQKRESNYEFTASRSHYTNKQEMKLRSIACALVNGANSLSNPMCQLVYGYQLHKFVDEEEDTGFGAINISCIRCGNLKPGEREACFNIVEQNWRLGLNTPPPSKQKKWHDLFDCYNSWYILCRHKGFLVGFVHFRFVVACLKAVLDCRDIHLCQDIRGKALGRRLMQLQIDLARKTRMDAVTVTVPSVLINSIPFFKALDFHHVSNFNSENDGALEEDENMTSFMLSRTV